MRSPFPGMDPYLEAQGYWPDFHAKFLNYWQEAISDALPASYEARIDERVRVVEVDQGQSHLLKPDIAIVHNETARNEASEGGVATMEAVALESVTLSLPALEEVRDSWIQILHRPDRTLVAVLELLSPANKIGDGRDRYLAKRTDVLVQDVHLVEVDLLLAGERLPMQQPLPKGDFYAIVARADRRPKAEVYAWTLHRKLPAIPIPLLKQDGQIQVDLAQVFATAFERGKYARSINYAKTVDLPVGPERAQWIAETARSPRNTP